MADNADFPKPKNKEGAATLFYFTPLNRPRIIIGMQRTTSLIMLNP